jgi:hypothetical protein
MVLDFNKETNKKTKTQTEKTVVYSGLHKFPIDLEATSKN